jgi:hypothetical protein
MHESTRRTADGADESAESAAALAELSSRLRSTVDRFQLDASRPASPAGAAPPAPGTAPGPFRVERRRSVYQPN